MPDNDNIARQHPRGWRRCPDAASRGSEVFAQYVHHLVAKEIRIKEDIKPAVALIENLLQQVYAIASLPIEHRATADLKLPKAAESSREKLMAVQAVKRVLVELTFDGDMTPQDIREWVFKEFCLEIARVNAFGPLLTRGIPFPYSDVDMAQDGITACEEKLQEAITPTALELAENPTTCKVKTAKAPQMPKKSQEDLVKEEIEIKV